MSKHFSKIFKIVIIGVLIAIPVYSFPQIYSFKQYSIKQGLADNHVNDILQDSAGYLWIATNNGLSRFNGQVFKNYTVNQGLADNYCQSLCLGPNNQLWVGTTKGISILHNNRFDTLKSKNGLKGNVVITMVLHNNKMYVGTNNGGINIIDLETDTLQIKTINYNDGLKSNFIFDIQPDAYSRLWVGLLNGLQVIDLNKQTYQIYNIDNYALIPSRGEYFVDIEQISQDEIWVATAESGVFKFSNIRDLRNIKTINVKKDHGLSENYVNDLQKLNSNTVWAATNEGISLLQPNQIKIFNQENGLEYSQIFDLYKDKDQNIWIGSAENGLLKFLGHNLTQYYVPHKNTRTIKNINDIHYIGGNMLIVSDEKGITKINIGNNNFNLTQTFPEITDYSIVKEIVGDNKGNLWINAVGRGLLHYGSNGAIKRYSTTRENLSHNTINHIMIASTGKVYVSTNGGYNVIENNGKVLIRSLKKDFDAEKVRYAVEDKRKIIWLATDIGVVASMGERVSSFDAKEGLTDADISHLALDDAGNLWISTLSDSIFVIAGKEIDNNLGNIQNIKVAKFNTGNIKIDNIRALTTLGKNDLLIAVSNGFHVLHYNNLLELTNSRFYGPENGFSDGQVKMNAVTKDDDDRVWFGTTGGGITCYDASKDLIQLSSPLIDYSKIEIDRTPIEHEYLSKAYFNGLISLELPYHISRIEFFINAGSLIQPNPVKFAYYCEGIEKDWQPLQDRGEFAYNRPSPGFYTFHVRAVDDKGVWSDTISYHFRVKPPIYLTWWFITLVIIIGILAGVVYVKYRTRMLRHERDKLEKIVKQRTWEIQQQKEKIQEQRDLVTQKNKEIEDSITYAQRIQQALLDVSDRLEQTSFEHFIFFKPRDIVSGDFYWSDGSTSEPIITVADCTGHGVPGAFMSLLGINYLNRIVNEQQINMPNEILNHLRDRIIKALQQEYVPLGLRDGMDMTLVKINKESGKLYCAGAYNSLFCFRNGELSEIKVDRFSVSVSEEMKPFQLFEMQLQENDMLYMYSDGYKDQLGGPKEKKINSKNFKALLQSVCELPMHEQYERIDQYLSDWQMHYDQIDDICIMGIRYKKA